MAGEFVSLLMADLDLQHAYELVTAAVTPRPIALISTCSAAGVENLAPFSFFTAGGSNPPSLVYSATADERGEAKNSLQNVVATGEFVVNTVHREMAPGLAVAGTEASVWEGYTPLPSLAVRPPRVRESLIQLECRLYTVVEHGTGPGASRYVVGEVVVAHIHRSVSEDPSRTNFVGRLGGPRYVDLARMELFGL